MLLLGHQITQLVQRRRVRARLLAHPGHDEGPPLLPHAPEYLEGRGIEHPAGRQAMLGLKAGQRLGEAGRAGRAVGGQLVLDVYDADVMAPEYDAEPTEHGDEAESDEFEVLCEIEVAGDDYRVWERNTWDAARRLMRVDYRLMTRAELSGAPGRQGSWELTVNHSVMWRHELAVLLEECGFDVEWGADEEADGTAFAEQIVVRASKS